MLAANQPAKFLIPFARDDSARVEIPPTTVDPGRFSQALGSPPLTGMPSEVGGVPPQLEDFNGAMNQLSRGIWWALAGGRFAFDNTWASDPQIGGYPRGAVLPAALGAGSVGMGEWYCNADNNTVNPDTVGTGWVPGYHYGATALTSQTGGTVTLTPAQAGKTVITVAGALTSNLVLVVPAWVYRWTFYNATSGGFSVTVKNAATAGVTIPQDGQPYDVRCNGTQVSRVEIIIPTATTAVAGISRLATPAEVATATDGTIAVTPAGMAQTKAIAWVTGLQSALDAKAPTNNPSFTGTVNSAGQIISAGGFRFSSRTVKDHVADVDATDALHQILALHPVAYRYNEAAPEALRSRTRLGYYTEDVEPIVPEAVADAPADCWAPQLLDEGQLLPAHTGAIQALYAMLTETRAELYAALERIAQLEAKP